MVKIVKACNPYAQNIESEVYINFQYLNVIISMNMESV